MLFRTTTTTCDLGDPVLVPRKRALFHAEKKSGKSQAYERAFHPVRSTNMHVTRVSAASICQGHKGLAVEEWLGRVALQRSRGPSSFGSFGEFLLVGWGFESRMKKL